MYNLIMPVMGKDHFYSINLKWTGNKGEGTTGYRTYERSHVISAGYKPDIPGSSDPAFRGDKTRYSPEDLLVASLSSCHMLWYLHLCADNGVVVVNYEDHANGIMTEDPNAGGRFKEVVLNPDYLVIQAEYVFPDKSGGRVVNVDYR